MIPIAWVVDGIEHFNANFGSNFLKQLIASRITFNWYETQDHNLSVLFLSNNELRPILKLLLLQSGFRHITTVMRRLLPNCERAAEC